MKDRFRCDPGLQLSPDLTLTSTLGIQRRLLTPRPLPVPATPEPIIASVFDDGWHQAYLQDTEILHDLTSMVRKV